MNDIELEAALAALRTVNRQIFDLLDVLNERVTTLEGRLEDLAITGSSKASTAAVGPPLVFDFTKGEVTQSCPKCGTVLTDWTEHRCPE